MPIISNSTHSKQHGFAMVEVLVTAVILAIGISGMGVLLLKTIQGTQDNAQRSQGMWIVQDLVGRIRANPDGAKLNGYIVAANPNCGSEPLKMCADYINNGVEVAGVDCEPLEMAAYDVWVTMCGFDDPPAGSPDDKIFDTPAEFVAAPVLTSTCNLVSGTSCLQYTVDLTWTTRIAVGAAAAEDRINKSSYTMVVELN